MQPVKRAGFVKNWKKIDSQVLAFLSIRIQGMEHAGTLNAWFGSHKIIYNCKLGLLRPASGYEFGPKPML